MENKLWRNVTLIPIFLGGQRECTVRYLHYTANALCGRSLADHQQLMDWFVVVPLV